MFVYRYYICMYIDIHKYAPLKVNNICNFLCFHTANKMFRNFRKYRIYSNKHKSLTKAKKPHTRFKKDFAFSLEDNIIIKQLTCIYAI